MNRAPLVSVVVIFRDADPFFQEAIDSVRVQTYANWELLLVDDGSTDASSGQARRCADQDPDRVHYLEHAGHSNRGMSASRNLGIRHARGTYVAFLDADDVWFPHTLEEQVDVLETWPVAAMVYGPLQWWNSWRDLASNADSDVVERLGVRADALVRPPTLLRLFLRNHAAVPSGLLVRRSVLERVGGFEDVFRADYEDQVLSAKICLEYTVFASSRCWYRYRQHADSAVAVSLKTGRARQTRVTFLEWLATYLAWRGIRHPSVWCLVRYELWRWKYPAQHELLLAAHRALKSLAGRVVLRSRRLARIAR